MYCVIDQQIRSEWSPCDKRQLGQTNLGRYCLVDEKPSDQQGNGFNELMLGQYIAKLPSGVYTWSRLSLTSGVIL